MALYSVSDVSPAAAAGAPYAVFRAGAANRARIRQVEVFLRSALASEIGLARALTVGTAGASKLGQQHDVADAPGTLNLDTAWSAAPTIAASPIFLKRAFIQATQGAGMVWRFPQGEELILAPNAGLLVWNPGAGAGAALSVAVTYDE